MEENNIVQLYTKRVKSIINIYNEKNAPEIYVFLGLHDVVDTSEFNEYIVDKQTFGIDGNDTVFSKKWFKEFFIALSKHDGPTIMSFAQFSYLITYMDADYYSDVVLIRDNLRSLYPLEKTLFCEVQDKYNSERRAMEMPVYQAEQIKNVDSYYYTPNLSDFQWTIVDLFTDRAAIKTSFAKPKEVEVVDFLSYKYAIDLFINKCVEERNFSKKVYIRIFDKHPEQKMYYETLERLNFVLRSFGGELVGLNKEKVLKVQEINGSTLEMLHKYWGAGARFRDIKVYEDPNRNNELVSISQGQIVDTIIKEYEKSNMGDNESIRDLFLTAPTGSGKSLLFQLPAFYVSSKGDVTIIVSPLIALMKDQVSAIQNDRGFEKVAYINSELTLIDREKIIEDCQTGEIDVLYLSPELLLSYDISFFIGQRKLGLLVIDEAHLITTWGRDFRVDYWYLGGYVRKIRKYNDYNFPVVAVTATAVYGGVNDMVFDSIDSLAMQNPYIYIGQVKRDDISFIVNNHDKFNFGHQRSKIKQTAAFIENIYKIGAKTIVYTPYSKHVSDLLAEIQSSEQPDAAVFYYGTLDHSIKEESYNKFKKNESKIMICTKAFGMGVDISDIEVVYHHAPSGLLPDYIQEVGRVARDPKIHGFAALDYSREDQIYSKKLHGMSSIKLWQLKEMLRKIYNLYLKNEKRRNLLVSPDDFGYIFNEFDNDQKVMTSLMMLEKDYLAKFRFNVLIARPKKLFSTVFARVNEQDFIKLHGHFPKSYKIIGETQKSKIIELDLNEIWSKYRNEMSFPVLKAAFYNKELFEKEQIDFNPLLKFSFKIYDSYDQIQDKLLSFFEKTRKVFSELYLQNKFVRADTIKKIIENKFPNKKGINELSDFIITSFSKIDGKRAYTRDSFILVRMNMHGKSYRIYSNRYIDVFSSLTKLFTTLFSDASSDTVNRYISKENTDSTNYIRLGYFLEMLDLGTFEMAGGDKPMIFIRINDPRKIHRDAFDKNYSNGLLQDTLNKFDVSSKLFDHFFLSSMPNEERWNFIEEFFLGANIDDLIVNHPDETGENNIDIVEAIKEARNPKKKVSEKKTGPENDSSTLNKESQEQEDFDELYNPNEIVVIPRVKDEFPPIENSIYYKDSLLTLVVNNKTETRPIVAWIRMNPVEFNDAVDKYHLKISKIMRKILEKEVLSHKNHNK